MKNPHAIHVFADWMCLAKSTIFVSLADAQAVSLLRGSVSVAPSIANQSVIGRGSKYGHRSRDMLRVEAIQQTIEHLEPL
jgi:hypothetical protein